MEYLRLSEGKQNDFLKKVKSKTGLTWKELGNFLKVSKSMIYFYLNETSRLPYSHYEKLSDMTGLKVKDLETVEIFNKEKQITKPEVRPSLAEFLGALSGDGHLGKDNYEVSITLDKDFDKEYSNHIIGLYDKLFNIEAKIQVQEEYNKLKCYVYSKSLVNFLTKQFGFPRGKKKGRLHIPSVIRDDTNLLKSYIRGLFDTDGSFHRHRPTDAMAGIISRDPVFLEEVKDCLEMLSFNIGLSGKNLYIFQDKDINRFFEEIKPANEKHLMKYRHYRQKGIVPLKKDLMKR